MVAKRRKKYESGEAAQYMSRKAAVKYLQLSLRDFRKLCILKGVYPREPRNRKRAQKGKSTIQTLYHKKDIQFLLHEPIIWKLRDIKVFGKKMGRAFAVKDFEQMKMQLNKHPTLNLDHIVKERYPTFIDALRDLDDCLTLCFLFSTFPSLKHVPKNQSALCRRLTVEFLHAVIEAKALRKVFISIKGYYYQIEFKGQTITWITPHHFAFQPQSRDDVDFTIMSTFVQFYTVLLGFVNFHMYHTLNLVYPPKLSGYGIDEKENELSDEATFVSERIAALNIPLCKTSQDIEEENEVDQFPSGEDTDFEKQKLEILKVQNLKNLFKGKKIFLNKEVPREPLVFIIRCFGGLVSWDKTCFPGALFEETDESISYQIVDRPNIEKQFLSRYYVQPQWVFDSVNACELLPVEKYLLGAVLPPHLSPFANQGRNQVYQPPEEKMANDPNYKFPTADEDSEAEENASDDDDDDDDDDKSEEENDSCNEGDAADKKIMDSEDAKKEMTEDKMKGMSVEPGEVFKEDPVQAKKESKQELRLREKLVPNKYRRLYKSMKKGKRKRCQEIWLLNKKRHLIENAEKEKKKEQKKKAKTGL